MSTKILQLQKRASYIYQNIQDKAACNNAKRVFALADGTTQSFNSERWATIITESFVAAPTFDPENLIDLFTNCAREFAFETFTFSLNPAIAALQKEKKAKGASATFLGLQFLQDNSVNVISCGDTNLFILDGNHSKWFPYDTIEDLNANNNFLNTIQLAKQKIDTSFFQIKQFKHLKGAIYIMATDALSRLFLKNSKTIHEVVQIKDFDMLYNFCMKYWEKKELEEDDISAIIINHDDSNKVIHIIPPATFTFPKEEEFVFTPATDNKFKNNTEQYFTDMQMQEIYNQFSYVAYDFHEVKRNQKLLQILVIIAIALSFLNLVGLAYMMNGNRERKPQIEQCRTKDAPPDSPKQDNHQ